MREIRDQTRNFKQREKVKIEREREDGDAKKTKGLDRKVDVG